MLSSRLSDRRTLAYGALRVLLPFFARRFTPLYRQITHTHHLQLANCVINQVLVGEMSLLIVI